MKFKLGKTAWIVIGVVLFTIAVGLGIMFSGEKEDIKVIKVPQTTVTVDTVPAVDSN